MPEPRMGEVWDVNFDPQVGTEQAGTRPAVVISNDRFNRSKNGLYIVVPITTRDRDIYGHVRVSPPEGGLTRASVVMCDQVRSQSVLRFLRYRGAMSQDTVLRIQAVVGTLIDR